MSKQIVTIICLIAFLSIVAFDVYLWRDRKFGNTISERARRAGRVWPPFRILLAFSVGMLMGHFYWPESCETQSSICNESTP